MFSFVRLLPPALPEFSLLPHLITDSFAVAIVGFSMGISLSKIFALKHGYSVDGNQVSQRRCEELEKEQENLCFCMQSPNIQTFRCTPTLIVLC